MIRATLLAAAATIFVVTGAAAAEPVRPALRAEAIVTGPVVHIGDVIDNAGIVANVPIFRSPNLGETGTVPVSQVLAAVRLHSLIGLNPGQISDITITRASRTISARELERLISAALAKAYPLGQATDISLSFDRGLRAIQLEPSIAAAPRIDHLHYDARTGRFDAILAIDGVAPLRLSGGALATIEVVSLTRALARGDIVKMSDVSLQRIPRADLAPDVITNPEDAIGLSARNAIGTGRALRNSELKKPELVQRNDNVTLTYQVPGVTVVVRGKALDGGAEGDMIDVLNVQSNRTVRGSIVGPGQISIAPVGARLMAAAEPDANAGQERTAAK